VHVFLNLRSNQAQEVELAKVAGSDQRRGKRKTRRFIRLEFEEGISHKGGGIARITDLMSKRSDEARGARRSATVADS